MLFNKNIRSPLPSTSGILALAVPDAFDALLACQDEQKNKHDPNAKSLEPLSIGDDLLIRSGKEAEWMPGQVVEQHQQPRFYIVDSGTPLVRRIVTRSQPGGTSVHNQ